MSSYINDQHAVVEDMKQNSLGREIFSNQERQPASYPQALLRRLLCNHRSPALRQNLDNASVRRPVWESWFRICLDGMSGYAIP